jgi:hypothetical protein
MVSASSIGSAWESLGAATSEIAVPVRSKRRGRLPFGVIYVPFWSCPQESCQGDRRLSRDSPIVIHSAPTSQTVALPKASRQENPRSWPVRPLSCSAPEARIAGTGGGDSQHRAGGNGKRAAIAPRMVWNSARGLRPSGKSPSGVADDPGADLDQSLTQRGLCRHGLAVERPWHSRISCRAYGDILCKGKKDAISMA